MYSLETKSLDKILVRCTLPVRDVVLSPDGVWAAVSSEFVLLSLFDMSKERTDDGTANLL